MSIFNKLFTREEEIQEPERESEDEMKGRRYLGKIVKLDKGWGFIVSRELPYKRIFFHWSALNQDTRNFTELTKGDEVEFETLEIAGRGIRAIRIKVLS